MLCQFYSVVSDMAWHIYIGGGGELFGVFLKKAPESC